MKTTIDAFVLCKEYVQDASTGLVSIINMVDDISVGGFPANVGPLATVAKIRVEDCREQQILPISLKLLDPDDTPIAPDEETFEAPLNPNQEFQLTGLLLNINNIECTKEGIYSLVLLIDGKEKKRVHFAVRSLKDEKGNS